MSSLASFSNTITANVSAKAQYSYNREPLLLPSIVRETLIKGYYADGTSYTHEVLTKFDKYAAHALSKTIIELYPDSLKDRTADDYERFTEDENLLVGIVDENEYLVGMYAIEAMDDESDHGSGPVVLHNDSLNSFDQMHWKTMCLLPEASGKGHVEEAYEVRVGVFVNSSDLFAVLKSNTQHLIDLYTNPKKGWHNLTKNPKLGWSLDYRSEKANIGKSVDVLILDKDTAKEWYQENNTGITLPKSCIKGHAPSAEYPKQTLN